MGEQQQVFTNTSVPSWWTEHASIGDFPLDQIAFDLNQPRRNAADADIEQLAESIRQHGVVQRVILTPLADAPFISVADEHKGRFAGCVAGERRARACLLLGLKTIPAEIRCYETEQDYERDQTLTNDGKRIGEIDLAWQIEQLYVKGRSIDYIADLLQLSKSMCERRHKLIWLSPNIVAAELGSHLAKKDRMGLVLAEHLADLPIASMDDLRTLKKRFNCNTSLKETAGDGYDTRYRLQELWLEVVRRRKLSDKEAIAFINSQGETLAQQNSAAQTKPKRVPGARKAKAMRLLIHRITDSAAVDWTPEEYRTMLSNVSEGEARTMIDELRLSQDFIEGMADMIEKQLDATKK